MLTSLTIEGFRGFSNERTLFPAVPNGTPGSGLTIVLGPNNSGKSSLLEPFKVRGRHAPTFNVGLRNQATDYVRLVFEFPTHSETLESLEKGTSRTKSDNLNSGNEKVYYVQSRRHINHFFGRTGATDRTDFMRSYLNSSEDRGPQVNSFESRLTYLYEHKDEFNPFIRAIIPDFMDWSIDEDQTGTSYLKMWTDTKTHSSAGVGEGVVSAIVISAALYDSQPGETIVIDEPELSLHPHVQRRLMGSLIALSADRQIIIATHSPYFLTREAILGGCKIVRTWDRADGIELKDVSIDDSAHLTAMMAFSINNPHQFGLDAREAFFFDDGVLVLEGQEDAVLWPVAVSEVEPIKYNIFGWGAGGASNVRNVLGVLQKLGFEKIAAVLDNDRPADAAQLREQFPNYLIKEIPASDIRTKPAVPARPEKIGLLDENRKIRPEFATEFDQIKNDIAVFLG